MPVRFVSFRFPFHRIVDVITTFADIGPGLESPRIVPDLLTGKIN